MEQTLECEIYSNIADNKSNIRNYGSIVNLTATLTDMHNKVPVNGSTINFTFNNVPIGSNFTNTSGIATIQYALSPGIYMAQFTGNNIYSSSSGL